MIRGVIPSTLDPGVKQRLESLTKAVGEPTATPYSIVLPSASPERRGHFALLRDASGIDTLYVCVLTSEGVYTWWPVVSSS